MTLVGHFARFNEWAEIDSYSEGHFLERIAPGSFVRTLAEDRIRVTLNHGKDPDLGDKPIASPDVLREDPEGAWYEAPLLDGVPLLVVSGLRARQYGSSFRFEVIGEDFDRGAKRSDYNPQGLPERTITEARVHEFGPVTYPAYEGATAGLRTLWTPARRQRALVLLGAPTTQGAPRVWTSQTVRRSAGASFKTSAHPE